MTDGKQRQSMVFLHHKEGFRQPVMIKVSPVRDEQGKIIGAIEIFTDKHENSELQDEIFELREEVRKDKLTGLYHRDHTLNALKKLLATDELCGLLFIDLDDFKQVNDSFGHEAGDKALIMVAETMSRAVREKDLVARWGGEEFVAVLPGLNGEILKRLAERIRILIQSSWLYLPDGQRLHVTASIGACIRKTGESAEQLINRADSMMYDAKSHGKNKVITQDFMDS